MSTSSTRLDPSCWVCHNNGSDFHCLRCGLGFHLDCADQTEEDFIRGPPSKFRSICKQCNDVQKSNRMYSSSESFKRISREKLNHILNTILIRGVGIPSVPDVMKNRYNREGRFAKVVHFMNLDGVKKKLKREEYTCTEELLFDLRKIQHTMIVGLGKSYATLKIKDYIDKVAINCREVDLCPYCVDNYYSRQKGPILACPWGHKLVLVDISRGRSNHSYQDFSLKKIGDLPPLFPGKIISYDPRSDQVRVRLFDLKELLSAEFHIDHVYHLVDPEIKQFYAHLQFMHKKNGRKDYDGACEELLSHVKELKEKFGKHFSLVKGYRKWIPSDGLFIDLEGNFDERERVSSSYQDFVRSSPSSRSDDSSFKNRNLSSTMPTKDAHDITTSCKDRSSKTSGQNLPAKKFLRDESGRRRDSTTIKEVDSSTELSETVTHYGLSRKPYHNSLTNVDGRKLERKKSLEKENLSVGNDPTTSNSNFVKLQPVKVECSLPFDKKSGHNIEMETDSVLINISDDDEDIQAPPKSTSPSEIPADVKMTEPTCSSISTEKLSSSDVVSPTTVYQRETTTQISPALSAQKVKSEINLDNVPTKSIESVSGEKNLENDVNSKKTSLTDKFCTRCKILELEIEKERDQKRILKKEILLTKEILDESKLKYEELLKYCLQLAEQNNSI